MRWDKTGVIDEEGDETRSRRTRTEASARRIITPCFSRLQLRWDKTGVIDEEGDETRSQDEDRGQREADHHSLFQ